MFSEFWFKINDGIVNFETRDDLCTHCVPFLMTLYIYIYIEIEAVVSTVCIIFKIAVMVVVSLHIVRFCLVCCIRKYEDHLGFLL